MKQLATLAALALLLALSACRTRTQTLETIRHVPVTVIDTLIRTQTVHDSVTLHDSIYIHQRGDTVFSERWHTAYKWRTRTDTLWRTREKPVVLHDSIPYPVEVETIVYKQHRWQQLLSIIGALATAAGAILLLLRIKR